MVTVSSVTSNRPDVFPLMSCGSGSGDLVTLGCLATGFTPSSLTFEWKQDTTSLTNFIQYPAIQKGSTYMGISQVQVSRQDWDARKPFTCIAKHTTGDQNTEVIKPNVIYELPTLKVCSSPVDEKDEASFSCFAKDFSPNEYKFKWLRDGTEIPNKDGISSLASNRKDANGTTMYSAASLLTVKTSDVAIDTKFTCVFTGKGINNTQPEKREDVLYKECTASGEGCPKADVDIAIIKPTNQDMFVNKIGNVTCRVTVRKSGVEKVVWENESGQELVSSNKSVTSGIFEAVLDITYDEWSKGVKRNCMVHHKNWFEPLKRPYERNNGGSKEQRPSVFMLPPVELTRKGEVVLTCFVKDFFPNEVFVSWFVDDEEADSKYKFKTSDPVEKDGYYSVYSHLTLTTEQWEEPDAVFSCAVYHESVAKSANSIVRSIGYRTFKNTNMVNLNMNVPETCKAS